MITLTLSQRLAAYEYALAEMEQDHRVAICPVLNEWIKWKAHFEYQYFYNFQYIFPEFAKYRPSMIEWNDPWWPLEDRQSRIDLLKIIIQETKEKIENNS